MKELTVSVGSRKEFGKYDNFSIVTLKISIGVKLAATVSFTAFD